METSNLLGILACEEEVDRLTEANKALKERNKFLEESWERMRQEMLRVAAELEGLKDESMEDWD